MSEANLCDPVIREVRVRNYSKRERVLFGIIAPIPPIAIAVMIVERATYADWFFWLALLGGVLVTALSLKIVFTGSLRIR